MASRQDHDSKKVPPSEDAQQNQVQSPLQSYLNVSPREEPFFPHSFPYSSTPSHLLHTFQERVFSDTARDYPSDIAHSKSYLPSEKVSSGTAKGYPSNLDLDSWEDLESRTIDPVKSNSIQGVTRPGLEEENTSDSSSNPEGALDEFIINPRRYQDRLAALLEDTTRNSSLFAISKGNASQGNASMRGVEAALNASAMGFSPYPSSHHKIGIDMCNISPLATSADITHCTNSAALGFRRCRNVLLRVYENINRMKTIGFCAGFINVLVMYPDCYDTVYFNSLDTKVVQNLFDLSCSFIDKEAKPTFDIDHRRSERSDLIKSIIDRSEKFGKALGLKESPFRKHAHTTEWVSIVIALTNLIDIVVLFYCSAHLERFDKKYLQMDLEGLRVDFSFAKLDWDCIVFKRRSLACLDKYLGNQQVWVCQMEKKSRDQVNPEMVLPESLPLLSDRFIDEKNIQLSVSAHIEDLADIWGPLWPVKLEGLADIVAFKAGAGVLVPWPKHTVANSSGEIYYHWTEDLGELPARLERYNFPTFHEKPRLLIGADNVEQPCRFSTRSITHKLRDAHCIRMQGTERSKIYRDSETLSGTLGYFASLTGARTLKRSAGVTVKENIISTWMPDNSKRNPAILECWYGVEVSVCTGNARRRRLKDIFNLPALRKHLDLCYSDWTTTDHGKGFIRAIADQDKRSFRRLWKENPQWQPQLQKLVYSCLDALRATGIDGNDQLSIFWMSDDDQQALVDIPAGLSSWTGILKNNEYSCTMAVLSTTCLSVFPSVPPSIPISECRTRRIHGYTLMETALVINKAARLPKSLSASEDPEHHSKKIWDTINLKKGDYFSLGQNGRIVVLESLKDRGEILACWEKGVGAELRKFYEAANENILKGSPVPYHWEVMDSNDEKRSHRPARLFLISHALKMSGKWKAF